jgi:hypothetical protein
MKLNYYTYKVDDFPKKYLEQLNIITEKIIKEKKDEYWENYTKNFFVIENQTAISIATFEDKIKIFATIYNDSFYGKNTYRLFNRIYKVSDIRDLGSQKKYNNIHITHPILHQQEQFVKLLNPKFYFISRQRKQTRWLNYYINNYNNEYNSNFIVSNEQYKITPSKNNYRSFQLLMYPKNMVIPFKKQL